MSGVNDEGGGGRESEGFGEGFEEGVIGGIRIVGRREMAFNGGGSREIVVAAVRERGGECSGSGEGGHGKIRWVRRGRR